MKTFSSLAAVMGLWLAVSFLLWFCYRLFRSRGGSKQNRLAADALNLVEEGAAVFAALRRPASESVTAQGSYKWHPGQPDETLRENVRSLLNAIETKSAYFDRVNAVKKKIQTTFGVPDFPALSEILQIRRDFWAASEIFLMDDIRILGPELAEAQSYDTFRTEARALLFKEELLSVSSNSEDRDPVELRLAIAREEAADFRTRVEREIAAELEKSRFPSPAEIIAVPWSVLRGIAVAIREARYLLIDAGTTARSLARVMSSRGLKGAAEELRRTRGDLPGQFATAFERAGGLARKGGDGLKRHYEFVLEAQELRARYAELLARAPDVSEKGKQFLARLEIERRAEQFRETSGDAVDWARQRLVVAIAYLITGLQYVQAKITPPENKQIIAKPQQAEIIPPAPTPEPEPERPLRVLLLPSSAYTSADVSEGKGRGRSKRRKSGISDPRPLADPEKPIYADHPNEPRWTGRLRDFVTGHSPVVDVDERAANTPPVNKARKPSKPRYSYTEGLQKTSFKELLAETAREGGDDLSLSGSESGQSVKTKVRPETKAAGAGSLLDRLSSLDPELQTNADEATPKAAKNSKSGSFRFFKSKRK